MSPSGKSGERRFADHGTDDPVRPDTATLAYMAVDQRILPRDRDHRDLDTRDASRKDVAGDWTLVEFRPARWLLASLTILTLWLVSPILGKRAVLALAWRFTPRRLRLVAGGVAALALVVLVGSVAAFVLVLDQLA